MVSEDDEIMAVTQNGVVLRMKAGDISRQGRPATGVRIQNLADNDSVIAVNKIVSTDTKPADETVNEDVTDAVQNKLDGLGGVNE